MKTPQVRYYVLNWDKHFGCMLAQLCCTKEESRRLWKGTPKIICKIVERTKK